MHIQIQRYKNTILFGNPDRIPLSPGFPRESTLAVWHKQGLAEDVYFMEAALDELGISREAMPRFHGFTLESMMLETVREF